MLSTFSNRRRLFGKICYYAQSFSFDYKVAKGISVSGTPRPTKRFDFAEQVPALLFIGKNGFS